MLDLKEIRTEPDKYLSLLKAKGAEARLQELLDLDAKRRQLVARSDELKALRNRVSDEIAQLKRQGIVRRSPDSGNESC